jgi:VIT1/CCC1 family predicted Fe2+/Mn2+ transporter
VAESSEIGHQHQDVSGGWLRPAVFGAMDGLVTNIALVAGVGGGGGGAGVIVLSGTAGLVAGAFSMALGEYASVETQNDSVRAEVRVERDELRRHPEAERVELVASYVAMGLTRETAQRVADEVHADPALAGASSFLCFAIGALVPLLPFLLGFTSLPLGMGAGAVGLVVAGALAARFTTRPWWLGGLRQLGFGAIAAVATYLVGTLIGVSVS